MEEEENQKLLLVYESPGKGVVGDQSVSMSLSLFSIYLISTVSPAGLEVPPTWA